jgi:MFS family permease
VPVIAREFGSTASRAIWLVNGYQLAMAVSVLPLAALGERLGYKRVYLGGVGFGFFQTPNNRMLLTAGPRERSGAAGGMMSCLRRG